MIAGSRGMRGAQQLVAQAASRCGAGYVYVTQLSILNPDFLTITRGEILKGGFSSCILGPGFRRPQTIGQYIQHWIRAKQPRVVLDAEALTWLSKNPQRLPSDWVLTPHEGEMARLLGRTSYWVQEHRQKAVLLAQKKYGCIVLLKGSGSLVCQGSTVYQVMAGNAALAKAGSGDVLAGMIGAFLAQSSLSPEAAVCLAVFVHGRMAEEWLHEGNDILSLRPIDLLVKLPQSLKKVRRR